MNWLKRLWAWLTCKELTIRPTDEEIQAKAKEKIESLPTKRFIRVREVNFDEYRKPSSKTVPASIDKALRESREAASHLAKKKDPLQDSEYLARRRRLEQEEDDRQRRLRDDAQRRDDNFTNGLLIGTMVSQPTYSEPEPTRSTSSWCGGSSSSSDSYSSSSDSCSSSSFD